MATDRPDNPPATTHTPGCNNTALEVGVEVFTEDGRRAIYAGEIDGQKFVRIIHSQHDGEYGYAEWPSDKLTPVSRVLTSEPLEVFGEKIADLQTQIAHLGDEKAALVAAIADAQREEKGVRAAAKKYPQIQTAIDFFEGKITHVVIEYNYRAPAVKTLAEMLASSDDRREDGLKLLCLFGTDRNGTAKWGVNAYRDGSGSWTHITPFHSESEAWEHVRTAFDAELAQWRAGDKHRANYIAEAFPREEWPDDWREHVEQAEAEVIARRVAELERTIAAEKAKLPARGTAA